MAMIAQILFIIISASAIFLFTKQLLRIRRNIFIGKNNLLSDQKAKRWKNVFLLALGQKKMFKKMKELSILIIESLEKNISNLPNNDNKDKYIRQLEDLLYITHKKLFFILILL